MKKLRLALAGAWHSHTRRYLPQVNTVFGDKIEWVCVWEENDEKAKQFCEMLGAPRVADYQQILDDDTVDVVICEAETCKHRDIVVRAAEAGKHVYTDKILTITPEDALAMKAAVEKAGVKFCVSHEAVPVPAYAYIKKLFDDGKFGDLLSLHFRRGHDGAKGRLPEAWFSKTIAGGGALIDLGIHGVSMLAYFGGKPKRVSAFTHNFTGHETEDSATILVEFESGAIGTAHTNMTTSVQENNFELLGTDGIVTVQGREGHTDMRLNSKYIDGMEKEMVQIPTDVYGAETLFPVCHFLSFVLDENAGGQYLDGLDFDTGIKVVRLVEAAYESAATGQAVEF